MTSKETIFLKCICLHGVPDEIGADVIRNEIQQQHNVNIVRIEEVTGAEANRKLKRWILELEGKLYVKKLKSKDLEINSDGYRGTVEFRKPTEGEVPPSWTMPQVPRNPKPTGRPQFNPQGPVMGQSTVEQNNGASRDYRPEQRGPGNVKMGQIYGQMNPGHGHMGQGQGQLRHAPAQIGQAPAQMGQASTRMGQAPSQMGLYPIEDNDELLHEYVWPDTTKQNAEILEKHYVDTVEGNKSVKEPQTKVNLTHLPSGVDEEYVEMILEQKKMGSLSVANVVIDHETNCAEVEMATPEDANALIQMGTFQMQGAQVFVEWLYMTNASEEDFTEDSPPSIIVTGFPERTHRDDVRMLFESKKFKDVEVVDVQFNTEALSAIITYSSLKDVELVMGKCPLKLMGRQLVVERFGGSEAYEKPSNYDLTTFTQSAFDGEPNRILVEDIPNEVDEDILEMCFSSRKLNMCKLKYIDFDTVERNAVITFSSAEDVKAVLNNCPIKIKQKEVSVQIYVPKKLCTIIVRGPKGIMKEENDDIFEMYFENKKKSGGGYIREINFRPSENAFYITYEDEFVSRRVAERNDHRIMRNNIQVELFIPSRSTKSSSTKNNADKKGQNVSKCEVEEDPESRPVKTIEEAMVTEKIDGYREIVKTLTQDEWKALDSDAMLVDFKIDSQGGIIIVRGEIHHVHGAVTKIRQKLNEILKERGDLEQSQELVKKVKWHYEDDLKNVPYDAMQSFKMEMAYMKKEKTYRFFDDDREFEVDFDEMKECPVADKDNWVNVYRKDVMTAENAALPEFWKPMLQEQNVKLVDVLREEPDFTRIETRFFTELSTGKYANSPGHKYDKSKTKINRIQRIQNKALYRQYQTKKKQLKESNPNRPANMPLERDLWHGTNESAMDSINLHGFNRSYAGNNAGEPWFGQGVYLASDASYSARSWMTGVDSAGSKGYIFLVKALTGQLMQGSKGLRYLPPIDKKNPLVLYDCAVDDVKNPMEFVIFNDTQAYPEYLITFTGS